jgi:branched-chain amino acid transport system ATP-binding protein
MIEVQNLSVSYGKHRALEDVALRVAPGEIVVILGANGAGKSTLLKAMAGICEGRVEGSVTLGGEDLIGRKPHDIVEAGLALVPEGRGVFGDLTVQENLVLGAYSGRARDEEAGNLDRVLRLFPKLAERRKQTVRTMSGGEQQMVAIGRAMMSNPEILALDEPSLGLSPLLCKDLFKSLAAVREAGLGVLLVEQNAKQSLKIADRGYLLENGEIVHEDDAASMANDPAVQKAYLGAGAGQSVAAKQPKVSTSVTPAKRPSRGPSPSDIAAQALRGLTAAPKPATQPHPSDTVATKPQPAATATRPLAAPDIGDLVSKASARASRRPNGGATPTPRPAPKKPAPMPRNPSPAMPSLSVSNASSDRLRAMLEEIETAARRAESYRSGPNRR